MLMSSRVLTPIGQLAKSHPKNKNVQVRRKILLCQDPNGTQNQASLEGNTLYVRHLMMRKAPYKKHQVKLLSHSLLDHKHR